MRTTLSGAVAFLLITAAAQAQSSGTVTFEVPFQWTAQSEEAGDARQDFGAAIDLEHLFASERGRLFYQMTMDSFGAPEGLRTWLHNAGAIGTFGSETRAIDIGGSFFWRANQDAWSDAGFRGVNLLASARMKPAETVTIATSYALYLRAFAEQPALDQVEHFGSMRALANLKSRTTLVGVVSIGRKSYDGRESVLVYSDVPAVDPLLSTGSVAGMGVGAAQGSRGWRQSLLFPVQVETVGGPGARTEWSWAARVAQSLDDRTGVWIEREERRTRGDLPPTIVWTPPLFYDDGVYDDPYVVDARTWRAGARHVFAAGAEIGGWVSESDRSYAGLTRNDTLRRAGLEAIIPLVSSAQGDVSAVIGYSFFRNASSDVLESYRAHQAIVGLRFGF
jgi:hypothetical protein